MAPGGWEPAAGTPSPQASTDRFVGLSDVGDDEHVQHHHRAGVHDDLCGGDEFGAQQQEKDRQREQVGDEREHGEEWVAQGDHADRAGDRPEGGEEEEERAHLPSPYSPSFRSGVRSSGSASSISLVKIRSERE